MSSDRHKKAIVLSILSAGVYLCLRLAFHAQIQEAGYVDGGLISYDSYYNFAFARELQRTGSSILFHNPFGSLDKTPLLFNLYSSILSLLPPLSIPSLFIFDCAMGSLFTGLTSLFIMLSLPSLGTIETLAMLLGGSIAFIGVFLGYLSGSDAVSAAYWGLTYLLNQISTPEIVYHFFVFLGFYGLFRRKNSIVLFVSGILAFLHPFTAMIFSAALVCAWLYRWSLTRHLLNDRADVLLCALLCVALSAGLFAFLLPAASKDALYLKNVYERACFNIDIRVYALFLVCPASFLAASLLLGMGIRQSPEDYERLWVFSGVTLFCILLTTSYLYTDWVVQPAHWSRAYPYVFLFGISSLFQRPDGSSRRGKAWRSLRWLLLSIALLDSSLSVASIRSSLLTEKRPPLFLTQEQARVIRLAGGIAPGRFLYLRDSSNTGIVGDFEYSLMSLTPQKGFLGHVFFSPSLISLRHALYPDGPGLRLARGLLKESDYVLMDRGLFAWLPPGQWEPLYSGKELILVKNPERRDPFTRQKDSLREPLVGRASR